MSTLEVPKEESMIQTLSEGLTDQQRIEFASRFWPEFGPKLQTVDGAEKVVAQLQGHYAPANVANWDDGPYRFWERCGHYYRFHSRWHEAVAVFRSLYDHMLLFEPATATHVHKGNPLLFTSGCYEELGCPVLARRYLMLATCEDVILNRGQVPAQTSGVYFRWVWNYGMGHAEFTRYAAEIWQLYQGNADEARFPEWILQQLDHQWMAGYPSSREAGLYVITMAYASRLLGRLGSETGGRWSCLAITS